MLSGHQPCNQQCRKGQSSISREGDLEVPVKPLQSALPQGWWNLLVLIARKASLDVAGWCPWCNHISIHPKLPMSTQVKDSRDHPSLSRGTMFGISLFSSEVSPFSDRSLCKRVKANVLIFYNIPSTGTQQQWPQKNPDGTCVVHQKYPNWQIYFTIRTFL